MSDPTLEKALQDADEGRLEAAIAAVRFLSSRSPRRADAMQVLAMLLVRAGKRQQALHYFARAVELHPAEPIFRVNFGNALLEGGQAARAESQFRTALATDPNDQPAWHGLLLAQAAQKNQAAWIETAEAGLRRWPDWEKFAHLYVHGLQKAGRIDDALDFMERWLSRHPEDLVLLSSRAHMLNYRVRPIAEIVAAHRAYGLALRGAPRAPLVSANPERPLRLGVLSGDLRSHSVGFFAEAFLSRCPADFSPVVFSTFESGPNDPMARRFKALLPEWHEVGRLEEDDDALDQFIRQERIDVLLDLSGHTWHNRLNALRHRPAPVIVHAVGNASTTGHPSIQWRVVDSTTDPAGSEEASTERLLRLDPCFLCFSPPADAPEPAYPAEDSTFTFGSFNNAAKLSPETIALWVRVLDALPGSRLLLKSEALADEAAAERVIGLFVAAGLNRNCLEVYGFAENMVAHLSQYQRIHVALDPFPYNGTTTTCEALWMGVPVVTLEGDRHAARVGASLLRAASCESYVALNPGEYIRLASELAKDPARLRAIRATQRSTLLKSALLQADAYGNRFFLGLRQAWRDWCASAAN